MKNDSFDEKYQTALHQLRAESDTGDLTGFEKEVWAEIALREPGRRSWRLGGLGAMLPATRRVAAMACAVGAVALGVTLALERADQYAAQTALEFEERYVASIHPVLRSETVHAPAEQP